MAQTSSVSVALFVLVTGVHCRVNVNVRVNAPRKGGSPDESSYEQEIGGMDYGDSHRPTLGYRSLTPSGGGGPSGYQIPRSSKRWISCQSTLWTKECEEGSVITHTIKDTTIEVCALLCRQKSRSYIFDEESGDCALTTLAPGGTTTSNGISGPELTLQRPSAKRGRSKSLPVEGTEDCSEFHFDVCDTSERTQNLTDKDIEGLQGKDRQTTWGYTDDASECSRNCVEGIHMQACASFASRPVDMGDGGPPMLMCGEHNDNVDDLIYYNCDVVTGRVIWGDDNTFLTCLYRYHRQKGELTKCRRGHCNLDHYGEPIREEFIEDEQMCRTTCIGTRKKGAPRIKCTHYKYHQFKASDSTPDQDSNKQAGKCLMYHVNETTSVPSYHCNMQAVKRDANGVDIENCQADVVPEVHGVGSTTTTTTSTSTTTSKIDCSNGRLDIAFLFDDSGSMKKPAQKTVKNFMKKLIEIYNIDGYKRRAAIMQWSNRIGETISFDEGLGKDELFRRIDRIKHLHGGTRGDKALRAAFDQFFHGQGDPDVYQAVIYLSDGETKWHRLEEPAQQFHDNEIRITSVYIGDKNTPPPEMTKLLGRTHGYENKFFQSADLQQLSSDRFVKNVSGCAEGQPIFLSSFF